MGRSITCNFQCTVKLSNGDMPMYGAMTLKDIKGILASEKAYQEPKGIKVYNITVFAQTKTGERYMKGYDYLKMDKYGVIHYCNIQIEEPETDY